MCNICGDDRCIGRYLLHPKEMICLNRIKQEVIKINKDRTFKLVESPGNFFTKFMELHIIAGPEEDITTELPWPEINIQEMIKEETERRNKINDEIRKMILRNIQLTQKGNK